MGYQPRIKPKGTSHLIESDELRKLPYIRQKVALDIPEVTEDEGLLHVKPAGYDVLGVLQAEFIRLLERKLLPEQRLFVIFSSQ